MPFDASRPHRNLRQVLLIAAPRTDHLKDSDHDEMREIARLVWASYLLAARPDVRDGADLGAVVLEPQRDVVALGGPPIVGQSPGIDEFDDVVSVAFVDRQLYLVVQPARSR
jgi:hypothetical protein